MSALASLLAAVVVRRRCGSSPAALALVVLVLGAAEWSGARALSMALADLDLQVAASALVLPGVGAVVLGLYCHARAMADRRWTWRWRRHRWLLVEPVLTVAAALSNPWHGLWRSGLRFEGDPALLASSPGPLFHLHTAYSYALLVVGFLVLLRGAARASRAHRARFLWPVVGGLFPTAGNVLGVLVAPDLNVTLTPVFFLVTVATCAWALRHSALPDVLPVALQQVVAAIGDAVAVVDRRQRLVEVNPAAEALLRRLVPDAPQRFVGASLRALGDPLGERPSTCAREERAVAVGRLGLHLDLRTAPLSDDRGACIGWVLVARDVTEALRQREELERQRAEAVAAGEALREQLDLVERLRAELADQAVRDPLTGLANRRRLTGHLADEVPAALAAGLPVSLVMVDVDRFKAVNDTHGHATGDAVLVAVAAVLAEGTGPGELAARFGGEEFVVVLPGVPVREALARAERWRRRCAEVAVEGAGGVLVRATASFGVSGLLGGAHGPNAAGLLLAAADGALYAAKAGGRDRVVSSGVQQAPPLPAPC
ncbi:histidine kinase N-terminal 7TM domain-containing protein [Kineococcus glutinatus]|uniref:Histidine kinase N-terminal 7TM domain-containing protein n=1 Tax=Kineococcus glutinatus TaxID=1070872 RepID=A0ABP9HSX5_9ACTN